jgi:hypothetical protein
MSTSKLTDELRGQILTPYACDCEGGRYIVVQAYNDEHARKKLADEYKAIPISVRTL